MPLGRVSPTDSVITQPQAIPLDAPARGNRGRFYQVSVRPADSCPKFTNKDVGVGIGFGASLATAVAGSTCLPFTVIGLAKISLVQSAVLGIVGGIPGVAYAVGVSIWALKQSGKEPTRGN